MSFRIITADERLSAAENKTSLAIVDANNQVNESNEGNNQGTISPFGVTDH